MAGFITNDSRLIYNGVIFPAQISVSVSITPVYSPRSDMSVIGTKYRLSVVAMLHDYMDTLGGLNIELGFPAILEKLQEPGAPLTIQGLGLGTLLINYSSTGLRDIDNGPKPRVIEWTPIGNNISIRVRWEVEFTLPPCPAIDKNVYLNNPLSIEYDTDFSINESGLLQITRTGSMTVASPRRTGDESNPCYTLISPDHGITNDMRLFVTNRFRLFEGFLRTSQDFTASADNRTLSFRLTDTESPSDNPYYPGCINPQVTVSVNNRDGDLSMTLWNMSISGTIGVSKGHPRWYAWAAFWMIVEQRIKMFRHRSTISVGSKKGDAIWITNFHFSEEVFERSMSFSVNIFCTCDLVSIMQATGMWEPIRYYDPDADPPQDPGYPDGLAPYFAPWSKLTWSQYRDSMYVTKDPNSNETNPPWNPYGTAGIYRGSQAIISICECLPSGPDDPAITDAEAPSPSYAISPEKDLPSAQSTWVGFKSNVELVQQTNTHQHNLLTTPEPNLPPQTFDAGYTNYAGVNQGPLTVPPITQRRTQTEYYVRFTGMAKRIGYPIPQVELISYGGQTPTLVGTRRWSHTKIGNYGSQPLYLAMWDAWYTVPMAPTTDTSTIVPDVDSVFRAPSVLDT